MKKTVLRISARIPKHISAIESGQISVAPNISRLILVSFQLKSKTAEIFNSICLLSNKM